LFCKKAILKVTKGHKQSYVSMMVDNKPKLLVAISERQHARLHGDILVRIVRNYVAKPQDVPTTGGFTVTIRTKLDFDQLKTAMVDRRTEWLDHIAKLEKKKPDQPVVLIAPE
jgi:hypothetical protein